MQQIHTTTGATVYPQTNVSTQPPVGFNPYQTGANSNGYPSEPAPPYPAQHSFPANQATSSPPVAPPSYQDATVDSTYKGSSE